MSGNAERRKTTHAKRSQKPKRQFIGKLNQVKEKKNLLAFFWPPSANVCVCVCARENGAPMRVKTMSEFYFLKTTQNSPKSQFVVLGITYIVRERT